MENASKALLMAAAILIAILILTLLVIFGDELAAYFSASHEEVMLQQMIEFNKKFQNYNGKTIRGSDLVSIMNKVVDYNNYQAEMVGYEKVKIEINLLGHKDEFLYNGETGANKLIKTDPIKNFNASGVVDDTTIKNISGTSNTLSAIFEITDVQLQKLAGEISNIVNDNGLSGDALKSYQDFRTQKLTTILGSKATEISIGKIKQATYQYYQFTQFKRAMFKCTGVEYDEKVGRVNKLTFQVLEETNASGVKTIKFD